MEFPWYTSMLLGFGRRRYMCHIGGICGVVLSFACNAQAAPSVEETLQRFKPTQADVDFDQPNDQQAAQAELKSVREGSAVGWIVRDAGNQILRKFLDTNGDTKVDRWSYFKGGVEVYRDIDADFDGRADQFRWLGSAGIRWGIDNDGDGRIDIWKSISAREVSQELVAAMKTRDQQRFARLFASDQEIQLLGVSPTEQQELSEGRASAIEYFSKAAGTQSLLAKDAHWVHFSGVHGVLPAGSGGRTKDVFVYDNVIAVVQHGETHRQLTVGALIESVDAWRLVLLPPALLPRDQASAYTGRFFTAAGTTAVSQVPMVSGEISAEMQGQLSELEKIDQQLGSATQSQQGLLHQRRAEVLLKIITASKNPEEKSSWIRQFADTVSAAVQAGVYPEGLQQLKSLGVQVSQAEGPDKAYVQFRLLSASYGEALRQSPDDFDKVQEKWLTDLSGFVKQFPSSADAPEALFQLAIAEEFAGSDERAIAYYAEIESKYPQSAIAGKAIGAQRRLKLKGRPLALVADTLAGEKYDTRSLNGRVVVVQYWASWSEPSTRDMVLLKQLRAKYGSKLGVVGVNLDGDPKSAREMVKKQGFSWEHLYSPGGMDSSLANQLGVVSVPMVIVIGADGLVVKTSVHSGELDALLGDLLK